tara:strand:- start:4664 stop:5611 length:948 start_codon:yes stop_codon:yes gene_type:complete
MYSYLEKCKRLGLFFLLLFLTSACAYNDSENIRERKSDKPIVLTTFTVLADIAKNIAGERLIVRSITKPGTEIHNYQFTPSDLIKARDVDLIIENGLGLELWIEKFISSAGNIRNVVLSEGMKPILIEGDLYAGKPNPHAWMSPKRTLAYVDKLVEAFIQLDPRGESTYLKNADIYKTKLLLLDKELLQVISQIPEEKRYLVSCEGAFSYLAYDYGMKEAYLWPVNSAKQVTPMRMASLIEVIKTNKIPTIFCETTVSSTPQKQVALATGASFGGNFFVDSLSSADGPAPTLLELYRYNLKLIIRGLSFSQNVNK